MGRQLTPEFLELVRKNLGEVTVEDVGPITADRELKDLGLDSMSMAELILLIEEQLGLSLERSHMEGVKTFGDLEDLLERLRPVPKE